MVAAVEVAMSCVCSKLRETYCVREKDGVEVLTAIFKTLKLARNVIEAKREDTKQAERIRGLQILFAERRAEGCATSRVLETVE